MELRLTKFNKTKAFFCLSALLVPALFSSCTDAVTGEKEDAATADTLEMKTEAIALAPPTFRTELSFYNQLFSKSNCSDLESLDSITGAISCSVFRFGINEFFENYSSGGSLNYRPSKIKIDDDFERYINWVDNSQKYNIVFHYGYIKSSGKIVYIMSKGEVYGNNISVSYCPFYEDEQNQQNPYYVLLDSRVGDGHRKIRLDEFRDLTRDYATNIKYNGSDLDPNKDPLMVYHNVDEFLNFLSFDNSDNLYLYIAHGALLSHQPLFAMGNDQVFFEINNSPITAGDQFNNKGLDIGRLCPPNCPTPVTICN